MKYVLIIIAFASVVASSQSKFDFNGYIYNLPSFQYLTEDTKTLYETDEDIYLSDLTRIRLRPEYEINNSSRITLHYELAAMISPVQYQIGGIGMTNRQAVDLNWSLVNEGDVFINHFIDRLYYKKMFDWGEVTAGRQRVSWGVGRVWQPTDLFSPINPINFSKFEKDGADAISAKYYFGLFTDLEVVYNFRDRWDRSNYGARFRTNYEEYDLSVITGYFDEDIVIGGDFAGNLEGAGVRGEVIYTLAQRDTDKNFVSFILGADYQFSEKIYGMIEYKYNGEGKSNKDDYEIERVIAGEILNVSKNYIALQSTYMISPLWNAMLMNLTNLNDGSGYTTASIAYNILQNMNISLAGMMFYGELNSEYSYFPGGAYMNFEYYF